MVISLQKAFLLSFFALAAAFLPASAQQDAFGGQVVDEVRGQVVDAATGEKIKFAHIENFSRNVTTFTDTSGIFTLPAVEGDTLVFSAIGYFYSMAVIRDSFLMTGKVNVFQLTERIYELSEATIHIPGTYKEFKQDFLSLKMPETQTDVLRQDLTSWAAIEGKKAYEEALARGEIEPPKPGFSILSADEKARLKLKKVIGEEEKQKLIHEKYNVEIVKQVTGLEEEDEILSFMLFCNFDTDYLFEVNPLDLVEKIAEKFEIYRKRNAG